MIMNSEIEILKTRLDKVNFQKLARINNPKLYQFIATYVELLNPERLFIVTDSKEDLQYIRDEALRCGEEKELAIRGHSVHFDGYNDQARDKENTKLLIPKGDDLGPCINTTDKAKALLEIRQIMKNIMQGHTLYVLFFSLGPIKSEFSIPSVQLTDSSYVAHSETILYRPGYEEFRRLGEKNTGFFKFVHSQGQLDERQNSKNISQRRIYIDTQESIVYSMNTQYGGNTIGLKKLAMRLAIHRASLEGWLTEHMFIMGIQGSKNRITYFTGAFPSLCGKTSTSMIPNESIIGDDIAYLRKKDGDVRAVNPEKGVFGIIVGINPGDDPIIWKVLSQPHEIIFSNVLLLTQNKDVYWIDKEKDVPQGGINYSGEWWPGKKDVQNREILPSHKNARFTVSLNALENADPKLNDPNGVVVKGLIYGGRDSDAWPPLRESFNWSHGIITIAGALESETTAATLGKESVPKFNPMSNLDFISIPLGKYIENNLNFSQDLKPCPSIFGVNYFLKGEDGKFLNSKTDKAIWLKWMELRVHKEVGALKTPIGYIPRYKDLKELFKQIQARHYSEDDYNRQFALRVDKFIAKICRIIKVYQKIPKTPQVVFKVLEEEKERLTKAKDRYADYILPEKFDESR